MEEHNSDDVYVNSPTKKQRKIFVRKEAIGYVVGKNKSQIKFIANQVFKRTGDKPYIKIIRETDNDTSFIIYGNTDETLEATVELVRQTEARFEQRQRYHYARPVPTTDTYKQEVVHEATRIAEEVIRKLTQQHHFRIPQHHSHQPPHSRHHTQPHPHRPPHGSFERRQHHSETLPFYSEQKKRTYATAPPRKQWDIDEQEGGHSLGWGEQGTGPGW